ncbi:hypothetical protein [Megalodesulfovibrio paquesii]
MNRIARPVWPLALPSPTIATPSGKAGDDRLKRELQSGRFEFRRFGEGTSDTVQLDLRCIRVQAQQFLEYVRQDLAMGARWFEADWLPRMGYGSARILEYAPRKGYGGLYSDYSLTLAVRPMERVTAWGNCGLAELLPSPLQVTYNWKKRPLWVECAIKDTAATTAYGVAVLADGTMQLWGDIPDSLSGLDGWTYFKNVSRAWVQYGGMLYITTSGELKKHGTLLPSIMNNWPTITDAVMLWWPRGGTVQGENVLVQRRDGALVGFGRALGEYPPPAGMAYPLKSISLGGTSTSPVAAAVDATGKLWVWGVDDVTGKLVSTAPTITDAVAVCVVADQAQGPGMVQRVNGEWVFWSGSQSATHPYWASFRAMPQWFRAAAMQSLGPAVDVSTQYPAYSGGMGLDAHEVLRVWGGASLLSSMTPRGLHAVQAAGFAHVGQYARLYGGVALEVL